MTEGCTLGFFGRGGTGAIKAMTAGHCDTNGPSAYTEWWHAGVLMGAEATWNIDGYYDVARINGAGATGSPYNRIYYSDTNKAYAITGVEYVLEIANGDFVNMTGRTSGTHGAQVVEATETQWWTLDHNGYATQLTGFRVSSAMAGGDSGGPVFYAGKADGLIQAIDAFDTYVVYATLNATRANLTICTNDACN